MTGPGLVRSRTRIAATTQQLVRDSPWCGGADEVNYDDGSFVNVKLMSLIFDAEPRLNESP